MAMLTAANIMVVKVKPFSFSLPLKLTAIEIKKHISNQPPKSAYGVKISTTYISRKIQAMMYPVLLRMLMPVSRLLLVI